MAKGVDQEFTAVFASRGPLAGIETELRDRFLDAARLVVVSRGTQICSAGDGPGGIFGVVSGGIGVEGGSPHLGLRLGHVIRSGGWFGEGPALRGGSRRMGYRALEDSRLVTVPLPALQQLQHDDPRMIRLLATILDTGGGIVALALRDLLIPDGSRRIAAVLLRVTGAHEGVEPTHARGFLLTQQDLGEMANASRYQVSRVLGSLEARGWIAKSYNHIRLRDVEALSAFAYNED